MEFIIRYILLDNKIWEKLVKDNIFTQLIY